MSSLWTIWAADWAAAKEVRKTYHKGKAESSIGEAPPIALLAMTKKIHYDDNIFFLDTMIKTVKSGLSLDIDPEYFIDKVIEDLLFLDGTLLLIFSSLKGNLYLLKRAEYLRSLLRGEKNFLDLVDAILEKKIPFSEHLTPLFDKLRTLRAEHLQACQEMKRLLTESREEPYPGADVISPTEFHLLLKGDGNQEERET